ncbi:hypothetical protein BC938DRAFT_477609 [Jimgerdemannia flammicorona]|uniref:Uncharacterized protein n=1 Tax=Jimgerdemannia flammicorona TaxID=994334 RepID=A0A433QP25_9FUNG|nr:hypothetical protein BC938DRAFT_477609 [Jimgerdemannia flammicorona]
MNSRWFYSPCHERYLVDVELDIAQVVHVGIPSLSCEVNVVWPSSYAITYLLLFVLVFTAVIQIKYLNKALQRFDSTEVIPTQFVLFTISAITGSAVLYRDFEDMDTQKMTRYVSPRLVVLDVENEHMREDVILTIVTPYPHLLHFMVRRFVCGCLLEFLGVYLITSNRVKVQLGGVSKVQADGLKGVAGNVLHDPFARPQRESIVLTTGEALDLLGDNDQAYSSPITAIPSRRQSAAFTPFSSGSPTANTPLLGSYDESGDYATLPKKEGLIKEIMNGRISSATITSGVQTALNSVGSRHSTAVLTLGQVYENYKTKNASNPNHIDDYESALNATALRRRSSMFLRGLSLPSHVLDRDTDLSPPSSPRAVILPSPRRKSVALPSVPSTPRLANHRSMDALRSPDLLNHNDEFGTEEIEEAQGSSSGGAADLPAMPFRQPYSKILHNRKKSLLVLAFNGHLQFLNTRTGELVASTTPLLITPEAAELPQPQLEHILSTQDAHTDTVRTLAWDPTGDKLITSGEDKTLKSWNTRVWGFIDSRTIIKRANSICYDREGRQIFVADKFGDVYRTYYHAIEFAYLQFSAIQLIQVRETQSSSWATWFRPGLGISFIFSNVQVISMDNKYIITADRDEHIRISRNPAGYNIESFCLGHTDVITSLVLIPWAPNLLISGGGDSFLRVWDYLDGRLIHVFDLRSVVAKYLPSNEELEGHDSFMVNSIRINLETKDIVIGFIKTAAIAILCWDNDAENISLKRVLETDTAVMDLDVDNDGNIWVALATDEEHRSLVSVYLRNNEMYERASNESPLVAQVNRFGTALVEKLPDLYSTFHLRKNLNSDDKDDDIAREGDTAADNEAADSNPTKKRKVTNPSSRTRKIKLKAKD